MILVFLALAMVGVLFLAISMFAGRDLHLDAAVHEGAPGFLSTRTLGVFLTGFGAVGAVASLYLPAGEAKGLVASLLGVLSGVVLSGIYLAAMHLIQSQEASSLVGDRDLVGLEGHVTVAIPENGVGEVTCPVAGQATRRMARAAGPRPIPEGARVRVTDVLGATVIVEPVARWPVDGRSDPMIETLFAVLGLGGLLGPVLVVLIAVVVLVVLMTATRNYTKVPPNKVAVFYGRKHVTPDGRQIGFRLVTGGARFKWPVLEDVTYMDLMVFPIDLDVKPSRGTAGAASRSRRKHPGDRDHRARE